MTTEIVFCPKCAGTNVVVDMDCAGKLTAYYCIGCKHEWSDRGSSRLRMIWRGFVEGLAGLATLFTAPRIPKLPPMQSFETASMMMRVQQMRDDHAIATRAMPAVHAVSQVYHIGRDMKATKLYVHPNDDVLLPYIVMTNRDIPGPLRLCGMQVRFDDRLKAGEWRIE